MARLARFQGAQTLGGVRRPPVVADTAVGQATQGFGAQLQRTASQAGQLGELAARRKLEIDDFERKTGWLDFTGAFSQREIEAQENLEPGAFNYTETMNAQFDEDAEKFIASLPESARPQAELDVKALRNRYSDNFRKTELKERDRYYRNGIAKGSDELAKQIRANPNTYEEAKKIGENLIAESGLGPIEKEAALGAWERMASLAWFETLPAKERAKLTAPSRVDASSLIRAKEGLRTKAYPDTGGESGKEFSGYRVGYGSDTVTRADGSVERVTKDTVITQADAERDLERRLAEFQASAAKSVGAESWQALPPRVQAALTSITYNYGSLPDRLVGAVQSGDIEQIATAIEGLKGDNSGVNSARRQEEADIVRGRASIPNAPPEIQERLDALSYEDTVKLSDQAQSDLVGVATDRFDAYRLQIATDHLGVDRVQILQDNVLDDGQKASLINSLNTALKQGEDQRKAIDWVNTQGAGNPLDSKDRKNAELVYSQAVAGGQDSQAVAEAITASKGVVPKSYVNNIRNGIRAGNGLEVGVAYNRLERLYTGDPQAVRGAENGEELEKAVQRWRVFRNVMGLDEQEAGRRLAELNSPEAAAARETLLKSAPVVDYLKEVDAGKVEGMFDPGILSYGPSLGVNPQSQALAVAEFKAIFRETIGETGGDLEAAEELAFQRLSQDWGVSEFSPHGDNVVLKHPAEKLYPPVGPEPFQYIRDQLDEVLTEEGIEATAVYLVGNEQYTAQDRRAGRPPRMTVYYDDKDGLRQMLNVAFWADADRARAEQDSEAAARREEERQEMIYRYGKTTDDPNERAEFERQRSLDEFIAGPQAVTPRAQEGFETIEGASEAVIESVPSGGDPRSRRSRRQRGDN